MISAVKAAGDLEIVSRRNSWILFDLLDAISDRIRLAMLSSDQECLVRVRWVLITPGGPALRVNL
jgi:hypothetical protein